MPGRGRIVERLYTADERAYWHNAPATISGYKLGGYRVLFWKDALPVIALTVWAVSVVKGLVVVAPREGVVPGAVPGVERPGVSAV